MDERESKKEDDDTRQRIMHHMIVPIGRVEPPLLKLKSEEDEFVLQSKHKHLGLGIPQPLSLPLSIDAEESQVRCLVALDNRAQSNSMLWFEPSLAFVPFVASLRWKWLLLLIEIHLGAFPGFSFCADRQWLFKDEEAADDELYANLVKTRPQHAVWTFVRGKRVASTLANARLGQLAVHDWIYPGDRIVVTIESMYVPAWLKHDAE